MNAGPAICRRTALHISSFGPPAFGNLSQPFKHAQAHLPSSSVRGPDPVGCLFCTPHLDVHRAWNARIDTWHECGTEAAMPDTQVICGGVWKVTALRARTFPGRRMGQTALHSCFRQARSCAKQLVVQHPFMQKMGRRRTLGSTLGRNC